MTNQDSIQVAMRHALISYDLFKVKAWLCIAAVIFAIYFLVWWFKPETQDE